MANNESFPDNRSLRPPTTGSKDGRPLVQEIPHDVPHPNEYVDPSTLKPADNGQWLLDEWVSNVSRRLTIDVCEPRPLPPEQQIELNRKLGHPLESRKLGPRMIRCYQFEPGVPQKIPTAHRRGIQMVLDGVIVGGLCPQLQLVGIAKLPLHPALVPTEGPTVPKIPQPNADGSPMISSALVEADDATPEARALKRARERRGA